MCCKIYYSLATLTRRGITGCVNCIDLIGDKLLSEDLVSIVCNILMSVLMNTYIVYGNGLLFGSNEVIWC